MVEGENDIPSATQTVEYNASGKATRLTDDDGRVELSITYGINGERVKCVWKDSTGNVTRTRLYFDEYEVTETNGKKEDVCYINSPDGLTAVMMHHGSTYKKYYIFTDHLGSLTLLMNDAGNTVERHAYDACGRKRDVNNWSVYGAENGKLDRGYTGHESLSEFGLINMNGRMYDPILGRMLSPDNYVQDPFDPQCYNRYSYCKNNPLVYVDPSGEIVWFVPVIIGAAIGTYSGGVIANNGNYNPTKWDYNSGETWGYMLGGAVAGGISGYFGGAVASSDMPFANTFGIASASFTNSVLTSLYTGGQTLVSISFGAVSYDMTNNEWGYLGKEGNSTLENIGYGLGALANLSDILIGLHPQQIDLVTENSDAIGHSAIVERGTATGTGFGNGNPIYSDPNGIISVGPNRYLEPNGSWHWMNGTNHWETHTGKGQTYWRQIINVNKNTIARYAKWLNSRELIGKLHYSLEISSCVSHTSNALNLSGVFNLGIHPYLLNAQMYLWNNGARPWLYSLYSK